MALFIAYHLSLVTSSAQVGEHRSELAVGVNGGYALSSVGFVPKVPQGQHGGITGGLSVRYTSEKYFNSICAIVAELNYPVFARLGWGRERRGFQFFFQVGPQFGTFLSESTKMNFDWKDRTPVYSDGTGRTSSVVAQDTMAVEHRIDYGIAGGLGLEYSHPRLGHFLLEGRYYYGLGDIYGNSKRDYFGRSNFSNIVVKLTYLFDIRKTKNSKIK